MGVGVVASSYDYWLVALSVFIAVIASFTALGLASRIPSVSREKATYWLVGGAFGMGSGIWAMHFIGMLAFHLPVPLAYDFGITALSALFAVLASGLALYLIRHGISGEGELLFSALLMAVGICAMHYTGMAALRMSPPIAYDYGLVALSFLIAYLASLFALWLTFRREGSASFLFSARNLGGAVLMGGAIAGMHYVAMGAANFDPNSVCLAAPQGMSNSQMAVIISTVSLAILLLVLVLLTYDLRLTEQRAFLLEELKRRNAELENRAAALARSMVESVRENARQDRVLAAIVEQSGDAIMTLDLDGYITGWNQAAERMFGYPPHEVLGKNAAMLKVEEEGAEDGFTRFKTRDGRLLFTTQSVTAVLDENGKESGEIHVIHDFTQDKLSRDQLLLWAKVYENSGEAVMITDSRNCILSANRAFSAITGYSLEEVIGKNPRLLASGHHDGAFYEQLWQGLLRDGYWRGEIWNRRKNGEVFPEWLTITLLRDEEGRVTHHIANFSDATIFKENEARIRHLAEHDHLTGLPNQVLLRDRLKQAMAHACRRGDRVALLFIDLDRFKLINDTLGHQMGDKLLRHVAERLRSSVRGDDTVSRQGGDEFVLVLQEIGEMTDVAHLAAKFLDILSDDYDIDGERLSITPSIGISVYPDDGATVEDLIKHADTAMYYAKEKGRANYQFFTQRLNVVLAERMDMEKELRNAIADGAFQPYFQPQIRLTDRRMVGAELLLRWIHPQKGFIPPDRFIPVAEESHLIEEIGLWVMEEAIKQLAAWEEQGLGELKIAVNVSPRQLDNPALAEHVRVLLERYRVASDRLTVEVTESALMQDVEKSGMHLRALKALGVRIAVDDFGTGYSSLNYLKRFPLDELKIDRSFIMDIPHDTHDVGISLAVIGLAHALNLKVVAEGTEVLEQVDFLAEAGCEYAQGYYFAKPMPAHELADFLARQAA